METHKKAGPKRSWAKRTAIWNICHTTMPQTQSALSTKNTFSGHARASGVSEPVFLNIPNTLALLRQMVQMVQVLSPCRDVGASARYREEATIES